MDISGKTQLAKTGRKSNLKSGWFCIYFKMNP